jgi:hypothetical protein
MYSSILTITAIESGFGFLLTSTVLYLVITHGKKTYHYLFAAILLICAIWDLGVFLLMIRNEHVEELAILGRFAIYPCTFLPALIFHFANLYTGRPVKWAVALVWGLTGLFLVLIIAGVYYKIEGTYTYDWGNIFKVVPSVFDPMTFIFWFGVNLSACWLLFKGYKKAISPLERRHYIYIISGFVTITFTAVKALVTLGINLPILLPLGMLLSDIFASIIGLAIIKDRLLDITVIVKKSTLYSLLAGLLIFIYSFSEHILVTYIGETVGEHSIVLHLISIAIAIAILMPVKNRLEGTIERYFAHKILEF